MVITILLLFLLFTAGLINIYFYVLSKKVYAWLPSVLLNRSPPTTATKNTQDSHGEKIGARDIAELMSVFATFDKNGDGFITKQELRESFKNIGTFLSEKEVEEMMVKVDSNGDGLIDLEEFCILYKTIGGGEERNEDGKEGSHDVGDGEGDLKDAFDVFDVDKDGLISAEELGSVLSSLGLKEGKRFEDCKEMIRKIDLDGDGKVSFDEFKRMMKGGGKLLSAF